MGWGKKDKKVMICRKGGRRTIICSGNRSAGGETGRGDRNMSQLVTKGDNR